VIEIVRLVDVFEMFPETDHAIIEDLYAQCGMWKTDY